MFKRLVVAASVSTLALLATATGADAKPSVKPTGHHAVVSYSSTYTTYTRAIDWDAPTKAIDWDAPAPAPADGGVTAQRVIDWD